MPLPLAFNRLKDVPRDAYHERTKPALMHRQCSSSVPAMHYQCALVTLIE